MSRGIQRERMVRDWLADRDWLTFRAPASLGVADVIALRDGDRPRLIEVKSTHRGPFHSFGPADRVRLLAAARIAGADPWLAWWSPRGHLHWIGPADWPTTRIRKGADDVAA